MNSVDLLKRLASHRPVSADVANVNATVADLRGYLERSGLYVRQEALGGRKILYAATCRAKTPDIMLNAHLDIVPASEQTYRIREKNGLLLGRGTFDCLGNCAMIANILIKLKDKVSVGAIFSTDEEIGGKTTHFMVRRGYVGRKLVIVLDGNGYEVIVAQKGILNVVMKAHGKACHAAEPWKGQNAIDRLVDGYQKVRNLFPPASAGDEWHNTMAATIISSGTAKNKVPDTAEMNLNIRFTREKDADGIIRRLKKSTGLEIVLTESCPPVIFDERTRAIRSLLVFMKGWLKRRISVNRLNGATDARHFSAVGVPVVIIGIPGKNPHGDDEFIDIAGYAGYEEMLLAFLSRTPDFDSLTIKGLKS